RGDGAVGRSAAADVHEAAVGACPLALTWDVTIEAPDPLVDIVFRLDRAKIAPPRLKQQNIAQQRAAGGLREIEQLDEVRIPGDQPAMPVEHTEPLAHVFEGALQQGALL